MSAPKQNGTAEHSYQVPNQPLGSTRHVRIVGIGAGMSGINMIRTLRLHLSGFEHVIYEKNPAIGGTWHENRYPGCACDIPSHSYQFSWRPNPEWTSFYSPAPEIQQYLTRVCEEEEMMELIRTQHKVERAAWDAEEGVWRLQVRDLSSGTIFDDYCHFLLDSCGILNNWKWPEIPGLQNFQGELVHSANWPESFDWADKSVILIGNGSSGIQILPELQKKAKHVSHFVREGTWIVPSHIQLMAERGVNIMEHIEMDDDGHFSQAQIEKFKSDPAFYRKFVKTVEQVVNGNFPVTLKDTDLAELMKQKATAYMQHMLQGDQRLIDALIPKFPLGCRRMTPGVGYLQSLRAPNVSVVTDSITEVAKDGLITSAGEHIRADAIICATGFDVSFCPRFPVIGTDGNLQDKWSNGLPKAYMSCAVPSFPNYFMFLGPNAPIGHGSVFTITEHIAKYLVSIIKKCQTEGIKSIAPTHDAVDQLHEHTQAFMPRTAWSGGCRSWFKSGTRDGPVTALHPGGRIHFFHMLERFRGEDWSYGYWNSGNRFAYLGNGFSAKEFDGTDTTWYLDEPDRLN